MVKVTPIVIRCLGGGLKELKANIKSIFDNNNDNEHSALAREMQKTVLWESESLIRKSLIWTVDMRCLKPSTGKFW